MTADSVPVKWPGGARCAVCLTFDCVLAMHPQVTGRPMRLGILRDFIAYTRTFPKVWYATGNEVAEVFAARERAGVSNAAE